MFITFFKDELQARFIQFIPIVERITPESHLRAEMDWRERPGEKHSLYVQEGALVSQRSVKSKQFGNSLIGIFDEWVHQDVGIVFVQMFDSTLASWYGLPASVCIFQETCGLSLVLEHNGDLYYCDHFVEPGYRLGNILENPMLELVTLSRQHQFGLDKPDRLPASCRACDVRFAYHGKCPRNHFLRTQEGEEGLNYLCDGYRLFFQHVDRPMRRMAELLRMRRSPTEIMQI
jgi:uncharacterized protein